MKDENNQDLAETEENQKREDRSDSSENVEKVIRKIAEKRPEKVLEMFAMEMSSSGSPLHNKMTPEHISQVIDIASKHDEREYNLHIMSEKNEFAEGKSHRAYCFAGFIVVIALAVLILFLFRDKPEVLVPILSGLGGLVSGFIGGWGLGHTNNSRFSYAFLI